MPAADAGRDPHCVVLPHANFAASARQVGPGKSAGYATSATAEYWYTVKENDNLWRIARDQPAIRELLAEDRE